MQMILSYYNLSSVCVLESQGGTPVARSQLDVICINSESRHVIVTINSTEYFENLNTDLYPANPKQHDQDKIVQKRSIHLTDQRHFFMFFFSLFLACVSGTNKSPEVIGICHIHRDIFYGAVNKVQCRQKMERKDHFCQTPPSPSKMESDHSLRITH